VDPADNNAIRIQDLEKCVSQLGAQSEIIGERTVDILRVVNELKADFTKALDTSHALAVKNAENATKMAIYERDMARLERKNEETETRLEEIKKELETKIEDTKKLAQSNQITLAKSLLLGGGSGIIGSIIMYIVVSLISKMF